MRRPRALRSGTPKRLSSRATAISLLAALLCCASPLPAQTDSRLVQAIRAAQEGQGDSARASVQRLLDATSPTDTLFPEILYTQAMVANSAADMRRSLQRVAVEYPTSSWVDDALLRLVQMDYATRSFDAAARNLERLRQDYPVTPLYPQAAYWAGRTYFELKDQARACQWLADGMARVGGNLELQNQMGYLYQRCGATVAAGDSGAADSATADTGAAGRRPDSTPAAPPPARPAADSAPGASPDSLPARYRVQVAAVATPGAADDAAEAAERLGYPAVIVREKRLYKVRAGVFATKEEARAAQARLKAGMGGQPFVVEIP